MQTSVNFYEISTVRFLTWYKSEQTIQWMNHHANSKLSLLTSALSACECIRVQGPKIGQELSMCGFGLKIGQFLA